MKFIRLVDSQYPFDLAAVLATRHAIFPVEAKYIDFAELGFAIIDEGIRPTCDEGTHRVEDGDVICVNGTWTQTYIVEALPQEEIDSALEQQQVLQYQHGKSVVELLLNQAAQQRDYDTIQSAVVRAAYPGPYQEEGMAYGAWMDACWQSFYALTSAAQVPGREFPSDEEIIAAMPELVLPATPVTGK